MASARKKFVPRGSKGIPEDVFAQFMKELTEGKVKATKLIAAHQGNARVRIEYDDPNG